MVARREVAARISLERWACAVRRWIIELRKLEEKNWAVLLLLAKGGIEARRRATKSWVEPGPYFKVAMTKGSWARIRGGRVEKRRPSRTPPWAK